MQSTKKWTLNAKSKFLDYERSLKKLLLSSLRLLSELRYVFISIIFYLINVKYTKDNLYIGFGLICIFISSIHFVIDKYSKSYTIKHHMKNMMNSFLVTITVIMGLCALYALYYVFNHHDALYTLSQSFIYSKETKYGMILNAFKLLSIPVSMILSIYAKYVQYLQEPAYRTFGSTVSIFDGSHIPTNILSENLNIPYAQLLSIIVNLINSGNKLSLFSSFVEILLLFVDFTGHKKNNILWPTIFLGIVNIYMCVVNYIETVKMEWFNEEKLKIN